jgi:hypothetical protein
MNVSESPSRGTSGLFFPDIPYEDAGETYSQHLSPLYEIIDELKRKSSVTGAASSGSRLITLWDKLRSEPLGPSEEVLGAVIEDDESAAGLSFPVVCACQGLGLSSVLSNGRRRPSCDMRYSRARTSFGYSSPVRNGNGGLSEIGTGQPQRDHELGECPDCGRCYTPVGMYVRRNVRNDLYSLSASQIPINLRRMEMNCSLDTSRGGRLEAPRHAEALLRVTPQLRIISPASRDMNVVVASNTDNFFSFFNMSVQRNSNSTSNPDISVGNGVSTKTISTQGISDVTSDYKTSMKRDIANQQAAEELASLLLTCSHEMSLEDFGIVESETFTSIFGFVHSLHDMDRRMAGIAALDALVEAPSADDEKKAIKFANTLSGGLRSARGNYEFLSAIAKALGHMARKNVDFVESEITRALEWLRTERSDRR